jgi:hypothetical protein
MCGKLKLTKREAQHAIKKAGKNRKQYRREKRFYYCEMCNAWHLTSQEYAPYEEPVPLQYEKAWVDLIQPYK